MSNLQLIEAFCTLAEELLRLALRLASALDQIQALDEENRAAVEAAREEYRNLTGAGELPDFEEGTL